MRVRLILPYPHKALWPNGRPHWAEKSRETKKHKAWAWTAAKAQRLSAASDGQIPVHIILEPKRYGPVPDRDNVVAAAKSYIDGIAEAIGINDRHFATPTVTIAPDRASRFIIEVGHG